MNPVIAEWVAKAEGDFHTMQRESRARNDKSWDNLCFHAQQCVEKYLKARLTEAAVPFAKTHDLPELLGLVVALEPGWARFKVDMHLLTQFALRYRYPGLTVDPATAKKAARFCRKFRLLAREALGLL